MTSRIWKVVVGAFLAAISGGVLAGEAKCQADVCNDPSWPEMNYAAPPMLMTADVSEKEVAESVKEHLAMDASPAGDPEAVHAHMGSHVSYGEVCKDMEKRIACDELPAGDVEAVHLHPRA
jgi:hypothetical protein